MTNKLEIHGLDLTAMNIGDVETNTQPYCGPAVELVENFINQLLGSITFGPVIMVDMPDPEDEDDGDWGFAE